MTEAAESSAERLIWGADARRLRTARKRAGLTQAQLADRLQVQQQAVSHWETGKVSVPYHTKVIVAELVGEDPATTFPLAPTDTDAVPVSPALLTLAQAADYMSVSEATVKKLWQERRLTGVKVGRLVRFRPEHLDEYIERNTLPRLR